MGPNLEKTLHELFHQRRLNKVNMRKEFFKVTLDEVERIVRAQHGEFLLTKYAEAQHYRQSLALEAWAKPAQHGSSAAHAAYA